LAKTVEFEYNLGDKVRIHGASDIEGFVISLWYSERGPKYEVSFFSNGEHKCEYFFGFEVEAVEGHALLGFRLKAKQEVPNG
jgi:hypothetical protein